MLLTYFTLGLALAVLIAITPLNIESQLLFGGTAALTALVLIRKKGHFSKNLFAALVIVVSGRYMYWRFTQTMNFEDLDALLLGWGMFLAEVYFLLILAGSYMQSIYFRERKPVSLPEDQTLWPTVDIFIPTYSEPLEMVKVTAIAATGIDWPKDKINIYILDDGKRPQFRHMAEELGVNYIARHDNKGAKAGNLNHALGKSNGDLIAIFDCDHVPVRSFLQTTIGFFLANPRLSLVQTPHHFYNDDPFEKNLSTKKKTINEGLLFYGMVQDGSDFWDASFFCGSCAVVRRQAIFDIGGFATETVTEDAHTSLRMHQKGWQSAYLKIPQASGLATGSVRAHVGQRLRWGRGMLQIFRTENPLIIPGLSLGQRICYSNAMLHFLFPLPRIVLLTAPLAFLLFGVNIIQASPYAVLAYALPHVAVAILATLRMQSSYRQLFTTEVYETSLAFHLLGPILLTLINPRMGKFNVTAKEGITNDTYFDWKIVAPHIFTSGLLMSAILWAGYNISTGTITGDAVWTTGINIVWALISLSILLMAISVALEKRERRHSHRVRLDRDILLQNGQGQLFRAQLIDMSLGGAQVRLKQDLAVTQKVIFKQGDEVTLSVPYSATTITLQGQVIFDNEGTLKITLPNKEDQLKNHVRILFGRADAWIQWNAVEKTGIYSAIAGMNHSIFSFLKWCLQRPFTSQKKQSPSKNIAATSMGSQEPEHQNRSLRSLSMNTTSLGLLTVFVLGCIFSVSSPTATATVQDILALETNRIHISENMLEISLSEIGVNEPILLQGSDSSRIIPFSLRSDEVIASAEMLIRLSTSPGLDPQNSQLSIVVNGEVVKSIALDSNKSGISEIRFSIAPYIFLEDNSLEFRVLAKKIGQDIEQQRTDKSVWVQISNASMMYLNAQRLPLTPDLKNLPAPFFDKRDHAELVLPFGFPLQPDTETVEAATILASYWGSLATFRRASFPVVFGEIPSGNAVLFLTDYAKPQELTDIEINGPSLEVIANPRDVSGQLFLVKGRNSDELKTAAKAISMKPLVANGTAIDLREPIPRMYEPYDAPAWIPADREVTFGEIESTADLQGFGLSPGILTVNFKMAPDFFLWADEGIPITVNFRHPGDRWFDLENSRLDALINDQYVASTALAGREKSNLLSDGFVQSSWTFHLPPYLLFGENQLQFYFDLKTKVSEQNYHLLPGQVRVAIDSDSTIDLSSIHRFSKMPNLAFFAQSGLPYSKRADLGDTVIVAPDGGFDRLSLRALLTLVASISAKSEYPAIGLEVIQADLIENYPDKDIILIGDYESQPLLQAWSQVSPIKFEDQYISVAKKSAASKFKDKFQNFFRSQEFIADEVALPKRGMTAILYSHQSPLNPQRTVVGMIANNSQDLVTITETIKSPEKSQFIKGDLFVLNNQELLSFTTTAPYYVGQLPWYLRVQWLVSSHSWITPLLLILCIVLLALTAALVARHRAKTFLEERLPLNPQEAAAKAG